MSNQPPDIFRISSRTLATMLVSDTYMAYYWIPGVVKINQLQLTKEQVEKELLLRTLRAI